DWLGIAAGQSTITTEQHEKFARGFEKYLQEGVAPEPSLEKAFRMFREWLLKIYEQAGLEIELSDGARAFYARLLSSREGNVKQALFKAKDAVSKGELVLKQEGAKTTINRATGV
ncbi:hypothetical protein GW916_15650, partial [bacterium]|nr:hypothetical protein [bacterium]